MKNITHLILNYDLNELPTERMENCNPDEN